MRAKAPTPGARAPTELLRGASLATAVIDAFLWSALAAHFHWDAVHRHAFPAGMRAWRPAVYVSARGVPPRHRRKVAAMIWLKDLLFLLTLPGMMVAGFPYLVLLTRGEPPRWPSVGAIGWGAWGVLLIAAGTAAFLVCVVDFAKKGLGTPFPLDPPKRLVATGLYRWVRNPMYVAVLNVILGEAAVFGSGELLAYWLSVFAGFHLFVVLYEEPALRRTFSGEYETYCRNVPRWLVRQLAAVPETSPA